jgi:hypothetical protein
VLPLNSASSAWCCARWRPSATRRAAAVFHKPALGHASAVQMTTFGFFAGTAACLSFAGQFLSQIRSAPVSVTLQVVYLGLFRLPGGVPTTLGFTTWSYALARTTTRGWAWLIPGQSPDGLLSPEEPFASPGVRIALPFTSRSELLLHCGRGCGAGPQAGDRRHQHRRHPRRNRRGTNRTLTVIDRPTCLTGRSSQRFSGSGADTGGVGGRPRVTGGAPVLLVRRCAATGSVNARGCGPAGLA